MAICMAASPKPPAQVLQRSEFPKHRRSVLATHMRLEMLIYGEQALKAASHHACTLRQLKVCAITLIKHEKYKAPVAACTRTRDPVLMAASSCRQLYAVKKTVGMVAASVNETAGGLATRAWPLQITADPKQPAAWPNTASPTLQNQISYVMEGGAIRLCSALMARI